MNQQQNLQQKVGFATVPYILFRKKLYSKLEELQTDVDEWIRKYNYERPHSGKYCYGKTPYQTFLESKHIAIEKTIDENSKINNDEKEISDSLNC